MFYSQEQYDEAHAPLATEAEADREYARNVGMDNQDRAWILSDRDVWYKNPFYHGPAQPHPEDELPDDEDHWEDLMDCASPSHLAAVARPQPLLADYDIPF